MVTRDDVLSFVVLPPPLHFAAFFRPCVINKLAFSFSLITSALMGFVPWLVPERQLSLAVRILSGVGGRGVEGGGWRLRGGRANAECWLDNMMLPRKPEPVE